MLSCAGNNKGFTLVELIVVMAVFIIVIMITGDTFNRILGQSIKLSKMEESNIEGVVGLEMFRHDLEQAGFGLPTIYNETIPPVYREAGYLPANKLNDAPNGIPRALVFNSFSSSASKDTNPASGTSFGVLSNTWYVGIKGMGLSRSSTAGRWSYVSYSSTGSKPPKVWVSDNLDSNDRVVLVRRTFGSGKFESQLVYDTATPDAYWQNYSNSGFVPQFSPASREEILYVYGVVPQGSSSNGLGMPFNRADYFVAIPGTSTQLASTCAPGTGILYKATVNHEFNSPGGKLQYTPLLDCVADMQVVIGWDLWDATNNVFGQDGVIDTWSNGINEKGDLTRTTTAPTSEVTVDVVKDAFKNAETIRKSLKMLKVYLLAQNGKKDSNYQGPVSIAMGEPGELSLTRTYDLSSLRNYRWKLYRIVVRPKNLLANQ
jgi:prepilin-type N-terminal cleavage/methylation domain-containing protein